MIPKVKRYRISWWKGRALLAVHHVNAPTKYLARLALRDDVMHGCINFNWFDVREHADRVTYYVERGRP